MPIWCPWTIVNKPEQMIINFYDLNLMTTRSNKYRKRRIEKVNAIFDKYSRMGIPNTVIYRNYIEKDFDISIRTFYRLLKEDERS
jgi:hypothetical protein